LGRRLTYDYVLTFVAERTTQRVVGNQYVSRGISETKNLDFIQETGTDLKPH